MTAATITAPVTYSAWTDASAPPRRARGLATTAAAQLRSCPIPLEVMKRNAIMKHTRVRAHISTDPPAAA